MGTKIMILRIDHTPKALRQMARKQKFRDLRHRMRAIALVIEDRPGRPSFLDEGQVATLRSRLDAGPDADAGEPCRWTLGDLRERVLALFGVHDTTPAVRRLIRRLGFRLLSPRPIHLQADPEAQEEFRPGFSNLAKQAIPGDVSPGDVLVHFRDGARIGQKGMLSRVWARAGTRPRIRRNRAKSSYDMYIRCSSSPNGAAGPFWIAGKKADDGQNLQEHSRRKT